MSMKQLAPVFGHMRPEDVTAPHIYKFLDMRGKTAKVRANRDKATAPLFPKLWKLLTYCWVQDKAKNEPYSG